MVTTDEQASAQQRLLDLASAVERHEQEVRHGGQRLETDLPKTGGQPFPLFEGWSDVRARFAPGQRDQAPNRSRRLARVQFRGGLASASA